MAEYGRGRSHRHGQQSRRAQQSREEYGYGREFSGGSARRRGQQRYSAYGQPQSLEEDFGYGAEVGYGAEMEHGPEEEFGSRQGYRTERGYGAQRRFQTGRGYGSRGGYRTQRGYETEPDYEAERGYRGGEYGFWSDYGERHIPEQGYDFEYGGRAWPYQRSYRGEGEYYGYSRMGRGRPRGGRGQWGGGRGVGFEGIGSEEERAGPSGFRRAWGRAPLPRGGEGRGLPYGREFARHGHPERSYQDQYTAGWSHEDRTARDRLSDEAFGLMSTQGREPRYGHTPVDRWPQTGHDLDHLEREELEMDDGEIHEAVMENLFQDSWIDPERIDIDVDRGVVTLTGEVRDFMEARYAWDDAWESPGVRGVINNLTVRADLPQEGMELPQTSGGQQGGGSRRR